MASLEKTWAKSAYSDRRETLGFTFSVVMVSSVTIVSLATMEEFGKKHLELSQRILLMKWLFRECWRYWSSVSWSR